MIGPHSPPHVNPIPGLAWSRGLPQAASLLQGLGVCVCDMEESLVPLHVAALMRGLYETMSFLTLGRVSHLGLGVLSLGQLGRSGDLKGNFILCFFNLSRKSCRQFTLTPT